MAIAAAGTLAFAGCGGGGGTASTNSNATTQTSTAQQHKPKPRSGGEEVSGSTAKSGGAPQPSAPTGTATAPRPGRGGATTTPSALSPEEVQAKLNALKGDPEQRMRVASAARAYLGAVAAGRWAQACSQLLAPLRQGYARLAEHAPGASGKGCAAGLAVLLRARALRPALPAGPHPRLLRVSAGGPRAFAIYPDSAGKTFSLPLRREGGRWMIAGLIGVELAPG